MLLFVLAILIGIAFFMLGKKMFTLLQFGLFIIGSLIILFGLENYIGFGEELESRAQNLMLLTVILPGALCILFAFLLKVKKERSI